MRDDVRSRRAKLVVSVVLNPFRLILLPSHQRRPFPVQAAAKSLVLVLHHSSYWPLFANHYPALRAVSTLPPITSRNGHHITIGW